MFNLAISCLTLSNLPWFMDLTFQVPMQYCSLDFSFTTRHICTWASLLLWPGHFILSGTVSDCPPLFSSTIVETFWPGELISWCHISLPFHTVHWVLLARILKQVDISSSSGPQFVRTLHYDPFDLSGPTWHGIVSLSSTSLFARQEYSLCRNWISYDIPYM